MTKRKISAVAALGFLMHLVSGLAAFATTPEAPGDFAWQGTQRQVEINCIACHVELDGGPDVEEGVVHDFGLSAHASAGLTCVDCHGGNPDPPADLDSFDYTPAKGPGTGFRGAPRRQDVPSFCGRCHSDPNYMRQYAPQQRVDQEQLYWTSKHGRQLRSGNERVATCIDCHSSHRIMPASDPRSPVAARNVPGTCTSCHADASVMAGTNLSTSVGEEYANGVHGQSLLVEGDVGAPACNDCHGNHGAAPPGVSSVSAVCSQCHVSNAIDFRKSLHAPVFAALGEPECETCHGNHEITPTSDEMLEEDGLCANCHVPGDAGMALAAGMRTELGRLANAISEADSLLELAHRKGIIVDEGQFTLRQAENGLIQGRASIHKFSMEGLQEVTGASRESVADARGVGVKALEEFKRRTGGWQIFLLLSAMVVVGLVLLIRNLERPGGPYPLREPDTSE